MNNSNVIYLLKMMQVQFKAVTNFNKNSKNYPLHKEKNMIKSWQQRKMFQQIKIRKRTKNDFVFLSKLLFLFHIYLRFRRFGNPGVMAELNPITWFFKYENPLMTCWFWKDLEISYLHQCKLLFLYPTITFAFWVSLIKKELETNWHVTKTEI